ncbi:MAG TPA: SusC/RagA family TonB-linked outer membrane protein [Porphyromonadaceae bacterium]|nr:SusC/RagA family TonB-linked outer membrane protein [Porphyromonadaceae bacterium]
MMVTQQQKRTVTGTITDNTEPVAGASIVIKGTTTGTISNLDGAFSIDVSDGQTLVVSFIGYIPQEIPVQGQTVLNVELSEDTQTLDEVVVTALGIKRDAKKVGYAVSTIAAGELTKTASPNLGSALYGKAAGVRIQTAPGGTGSISINVRGLNSITGNNQPLIIVDGVPIRNSNANNDGYWTDQRINSNGLADINPEDIETLSILKGASASALWGSEAANGVVMITTKTGRGSKGFGIDVNASVTADLVAYMPEYQTKFGPGTLVRSRSNYASYQIGGVQTDNTRWEDGFYLREDRHGNIQNSVMTATGQFGPEYDGSDILYYDGTIRKYKSYGNDPWSKIFRTGINQQYNLAITNATDKSNFRLSYTYQDNLPTQYNSTFKKHNFNLTGSYKISEALKVDYTANYILQDIKNRPYRISRLTNNFSGMFSAFDDLDWFRNNVMTSNGYRNQIYNAASHITPDEGYEWTPAISALNDEYYWHILGKERLENNNRLIASVSPSWQIINGLVLRGRLATDYTTEKLENKERTEQSTAFGSYTGYYSLTNRRYETIFGDVLLSYDKDLTDKLALGALVGWQGRTETVFHTSVGTSQGLSVENWFHLNASRGVKEANMTKTELLRTAYLGTLSLSYDNWAFLEGTARQETTSTLKHGNNSFFYPSVNASAIYTELLKDKKPVWFDYGKVRLSYGIVGNAPELYRATQAYTQNSAGGFIYNTVDTALGNETLTPETKYEWELGLEGKFFGNRLGFDVSLYTNRIEDQILQTTMPGSSGGRSIWMNVGELKNKGFELSLYGTPVRTKDWNWELRTNISWYKNKVTKLTEGVDRLEHWNLDNGAAYMYSEIGRPMGDIYAYAPKTDENGNKIVGENGLYLLTDAPVRIGNALPKFTGGFATTLTYKNLFMDVSLDYRVGGAVMNTPYQYLMGRGSLIQSMKYRDAENGGSSYYLDGLTHVPYSGDRGPGGQKVYDNGMILEGVKENGEKNDIMIGSDYFYNSTYNWGYSQGTTVHYSHSVFDNTYVKVRELSIGYNLPEKLLSKFACKSLQISVYGRNLFYIYKNLPAFDAEASDATNWIQQSQLGGSTATTRSFGVSLRTSF